jgi:UDPglucose--hexose-1-phosphate uridylyltransferase
MDMSEQRQDPTTNEWVIFSTEKGKKPKDFFRNPGRMEKTTYSSSCSFCRGNEAMTPPNKICYNDEKTRSWLVRAFSDKYPALVLGGDTPRRIHDSFFLAMDNVGFHEIIVETPDHNVPLALLNGDHVGYVLDAWRQRYIALSQIAHVKSIIIFKNHGQAAGTSIKHSHSQLITTPVVPRHIRMRYDMAIGHYDNTGRCLYSDLIDHELSVGKRVITDTKKFLVFHPFASHHPFETWILPKMRQASFGQLQSPELMHLAYILQENLLKIHQGLRNPDYNLVVESAPVNESDRDQYRWQLKIIPRLSDTTGFENGSGVYLNTVLPEETAQFIRDFKVKQYKSPNR